MTAADELRRVIGHYFAGGPDLAVEELQSRPWERRGLFVGERHLVRLRLEGPAAGIAADTFLADLSALALTPRGHLLADASLIAEERGSGLVRIRAEVITIEDAQ
jgi:hypothetical protein